MRRSLLRSLFLALVLLVWTIATDAHAADEIPAVLLAQLTMKVASYDRNHAERQKTRPAVLVVYRPVDERSIRIATMMAQALRDPEIGRGAPIETLPFTSVADLAGVIERVHASLLVFEASLEDSMASIAASLSGKDLLSIGTSGALVERGAVVGFELREGKPKIVVHLGHARAQNVALRPELLALARIVQ